jgi:hypothetical protein
VISLWKPVTKPGVFYDMDEDVYHAQHDWLSWSGMKHLIPPSTPAHFKASRAVGQKPNRNYEQGKVVHKLVLGEGEEFDVVQTISVKKEMRDAEDYNTKSARVHRDLIRAAGKSPILRHELDAAEAMAAAICEHPTARALLSKGTPEVSLFWIDEETGVKCRARVDWLPKSAPPQRLIVPDLKTAFNASPAEFAKAAANNGYYGQDVHYLDGIRALRLDADPEFVFVVVEKTAPHLVSVGRIAEHEDMRLARAVVDHCRRLYRDCLAADKWPGYGNTIHDLRLPLWLHYRLEEALGLEIEEMKI